MYVFWWFLMHDLSDCLATWKLFWPWKGTEETGNPEFRMLRNLTALQILIDSYRSLQCLHCSLHFCIPLPHCFTDRDSPWLLGLASPEGHHTFGSRATHTFGHLPQTKRKKFQAAEKHRVVSCKVNVADDSRWVYSHVVYTYIYIII